ncbi:MAG: hypothetical protein AB9M53_08195 [Leptothrix sp. (in: b-proteobacteria)]
MNNFQVSVGACRPVLRKPVRQEIQVIQSGMTEAQPSRGMPWHDLDQIQFFEDSKFSLGQVDPTLSVDVTLSAKPPCSRGSWTLRCLKNGKKHRVTCELVHTKVLIFGNVSYR